MAIKDPIDNEMERRLLLAMVLSMAALFLVPYFYNKAYPPAPRAPIAAEQQAYQPDRQSLSEPDERPLARTADLEKELAHGLSLTDGLPQVVEVENESLVLSWNTVGGVLESARLKHYGAGDSPVELIYPLPSRTQRAFSIRVGLPDIDERLARAVYEVKKAIGPTKESATEVEFHYRDELVEVHRRIRIPRAGYVVEMGATVASRGRSLPFSLFLGPGIGFADSPSSTDFANPTAVYYKGGEAQRTGVGDLEEASMTLEGPARWVALDSQYFTYLVMGSERITAAKVFSTEEPQDVALTSSEAEARTPSSSLIGVEIELAPGSSIDAFIGPKDYEVLREADGTMVSLIDFGRLAFLVKPLLFALKFIHGYVNNYGWSIIILTFVINLALFPVRYKQMVSMKKMSVLQPQMKSIQAKYKKMKKDDPRRSKMNEEVMALYKRHGVNPLGGCLPLVIQMPFLFAFYTMLSLSIELRGAPFLGWIQDLSRHDPYYITPIVMGLTMVAQQKMTPATGDATQRRMMMFLPVIFTFFFLNFSSGLVLYFLFSNAFGMMFQLLMQRWDPVLAAPAPAGKLTKKKQK